MAKKKGGKKPAAATNDAQNGKKPSPTPQRAASPTSPAAASASTSTPTSSRPTMDASAASSSAKLPDDAAGKAEPSTNNHEDLKDQGNFYFKEKEYDVAIDLYTQAIALKPDPTYYTNRAAAYMSSKKYKLALSDCQTAAQLQSQADSPSAKTYARLARCHLALGDPSSAILAVNRALDLDSKNTGCLQTKMAADQMQMHLDRVQSSRERKDWGMAKWALDRAMQACEGEYPTEWRILKVELDLAKKQWDEAISSAATALRLETNSPDVLAIRGLVLFLTNQIPTCLEHLKAALRLDQEHPRARPLLRRVKDVEKTKEEGNQFFKLSKYAEAAEKYGKTLELIGENEEEGGGGYIRSILLSNRATTLFKMKKHDDALKDTQAAIELMPTSFKALRTQARIRLALEDFEEAVRDFKRAQETLADDERTEFKAIAEEIRLAEVQLKRSKSKDYYKILNVTREATDIEIKKAYRRESLLHHPDKGGDEEKFKIVVEAHTVLSDPQRRARYDRGDDEDGGMTDSMNGMGGMGGMDINDLLFAMGGGGPFGGGGFGGGGRRAGGGHFHSGGF